jgi:beta-glucosidase
MMANRENLDKIKQKVKDQLLQMTIEEKLAQLGSYYIYELQTKGILDTPKIEARLKHGIGQISRNAGASNYLPLAAAKPA